MTKHYFAFAPKFNRIDLFDEERIFGHQLPRSGISYKEELDWIFAAWADNKGADEFAKMPGSYQSMIVAAYRIQHQVEAVLAEDRDIKWKQQQAADEALRLSKGR